MRWMALLLLLCLVGGAAADALSAPQYSRNQLIYLNGPDAGSFQQDVQKYWNTYVEKVGSSGEASKTMSIWFNTFPLKFESPVKLGETTFATGIDSAASVNPTVWTSMMLERRPSTSSAWIEAILTRPSLCLLASKWLQQRTSPHRNLRD